VGFVVDQQPVGALGTNGPYPAFGITIRPRCLRRGLHDPYSLAGEHVIERGGQRGVPVTDEEPELADPTGV